MSEYRYLVDKLLKRALELGVDEAEIALNRSISRDVKAEGRSFKATSKADETIWVRVAIGKKVVGATATGLVEDKLLSLVEKTVDIARVSSEDPYWSGLPEPNEPRHRWVGFDEGIATLDTPFFLENIRLAIDEAESRDSRLKTARASASLTVSWNVVANTRGVWTEDRGTYMNFMLYLKAKDMGRESTGFGYIVSRSLVTDFKEVVEDSVKYALDGLRASKFGRSIIAPVVMSPEVAAELLFNVLVPSLFASRVQEGLSPLAGKVGKQIASESFSLVDDGTLPGGLRTSLYDSEGVPRRRTVLVEKGVLKGFLYNTYTARRDKVESTGNASRRATMVDISHTNLVLARGKSTQEELLSEAKVFLDGYLMSAHTVNPITGDFSVVVTNPYLIENGEVKPLQPVTIAGNIYEILRNNPLASRLSEQTPYGIVTPYLLLRDITVTG